MGFFHVFLIVRMVGNRATHHILENNKLKSNFENSEILSPFFEIYLTKLTLQSHAFLNFRMHIFREPVILERQMSSFGKSY